MIDPHIFRAYDIRGRAGSQLSEEACQLIGAAFAAVLVEKYGAEHPHPTVAVGRDARTHSPRFEAALIEGLVSAGCNVLWIGQTPSPVNYFTICHSGLDAGVQITASHNPKEDNGIKLQLRNAEAYSGEDLQDLRQRVESARPDAVGRGKSPPGCGRTGKVPARMRSDGENGKRGSVEELDAIIPYIQFLERIFSGVGKGRKVLVDSGNGVAGPVYCDVLRRVGCDVIGMYTEPDGTFPNHAADPSKHSTLKELQEHVTREKADCGFGFDGDGDRMGLIDEQGQIVTADQILLLLAQDHLARHPGGPVIFTVSNSSLLETEIEKWGGVPVMCRVGHSFVCHAMREHKALLGGEQSGHFFCGEDYFGFDDALVASLRVLAILSGNGQWAMGNKKPQANSHKSVATLSSLIARFPRVYQMPELRPHCADEKKASVVERVTEHFAEHYPVVTLDGARIDFGEGAWAGIRFSNTSPCLSICIEARSDTKLKQVEDEVLEQVRMYAEVQL